MALAQMLFAENVSDVHTNTIVEDFPEGNVSAERVEKWAEQKYQNFGTIHQLRVDADQKTISVSFHDVRDAAIAMTAMKSRLGSTYLVLREESRCRFGQQVGERRVLMPSDFQITEEDFRGISDISDDDDDDEITHVEFYSIADASRLITKVRTNSECSE